MPNSVLIKKDEVGTLREIRNKRGKLNKIMASEGKNGGMRVTLLRIKIGIHMQYTTLKIHEEW